MYQALVKVLPRTDYPSLLDFDTEEARDEAVHGQYVYWYKFAEDDDLFDGGWSKGGAWAHVESEPELVKLVPVDEDDDRW